MHAESVAVDSLLPNERVASHFSFQRGELDVYLHLRSAGRGSELDGLADVAKSVLGVDLARVGDFAELQAGDQSMCFAAMRTRPSEVVAWCARETDRAPTPEAASLHQRLQQAMQGAGLLHVVNGAHGHVAFFIGGTDAQAVLRRLADDTSLPKKPGSATRLRLADLHATLACLQGDRYLVIVDVLYADFLRERVAYAAACVEPTSPVRAP